MDAFDRFQCVGTVYTQQRLECRRGALVSETGAASHRRYSDRRTR